MSPAVRDALIKGQRYSNRLAEKRGWTAAACAAFVRAPGWQALDAQIQAAARNDDLDGVKEGYYQAWNVIEGPYTID